MTNAPQTTADAKPWAESPQDVLELLDASSGGLSGTEAARRLERDGSNTLPEPTQKPAWRRSLAHFDDVLIYILIAAAVLKAISGDWTSRVISVVIVATAVIGFIQEGSRRVRAGQSSGHAIAGRSGAARRQLGCVCGVDAATLVVGDVVRVRSGDRVPADLRLLEASSPR